MIHKSPCRNCEKLVETGLSVLLFLLHLGWHVSRRWSSRQTEDPYGSSLQESHLLTNLFLVSIQSVFSAIQQFHLRLCTGKITGCDKYTMGFFLSLTPNKCRKVSVGKVRPVSHKYTLYGTRWHIFYPLLSVLSVRGTFIRDCSSLCGTPTPQQGTSWKC